VFLSIVEQKAIISLTSFDWLACVTEWEYVYFAVRAESRRIVQVNLRISRSNTVVTSTSGFPKLSIAFRFCDQYFVSNSHLLHSCYIPRQAIRYWGFVLINGEIIGFWTHHYDVYHLLLVTCVSKDNVCCKQGVWNFLETNEDQGPAWLFWATNNAQCYFCIASDKLLWLDRCTLATFKTDSE